MNSLSQKRRLTYSLLVFLTALFAVLLTLRVASSQVSDLSQRVSAKLDRYQGAYVSLSKVNPFVVRAAIASQDDRFFLNPGVDPLSTARAIFQTLRTGNRQGASTITEQLAKNAYYHDIDTLKTDIETKWLAILITFRYPKDKIVELYLNDIYYGHGAYGIAQASKKYFNLDPSQLSLWQSAYLIGLINAPGYLDIHPEEATQEAKLVLQSMVRNNFISPQLANAAKP